MPIEFPHSLTSADVANALASSAHGLELADVGERLARFGRNELPAPSPPSLLMVFLSQFLSPLIYVLMAATVLSIVIAEYSDAGFITGVLLINAIIGTVQEFSAQRAASALQQMVALRARVLRDGEVYEIEAAEVVPGDLVLLGSGDRVPADLRLLSGFDLVVDESLLTGESLAVVKDPERVLEADAMLGDRVNLAFAGTLVMRGQGRGLVVGTGLDTEIGRIAAVVLQRLPSPAPLQVRMELFTRRIGTAVLLAALLLAAVTLMRGEPLAQVFMLAVALAVSVIPEGLPVALTVALAIGMQRMARRHVIVRRLVAVEALGSCTFIATDKTGTLTVNQMTVQQILPPGLPPWSVTGEGVVPEGVILTDEGALEPAEESLLDRICQTAVLANDASLGRRPDGAWVARGDAVDTALLVMAHKAGLVRPEVLERFPEKAVIPFESDRMFAASLNAYGDAQMAHVKGALERVLPMCTCMAEPAGDIEVDEQLLLEKANELAAQGFRILAVAAGEIRLHEDETFSPEHLQGLSLLALVAMWDPLRTEVKAAVAACRGAGIEVAMITGDHPVTALAIARELGLAEHEGQIVTGQVLKHAASQTEFEDIVASARVFARVEPQQKLEIVQALQHREHFVAVSGDGANDAPALRVAQVGVAMGKAGTDVARETAELIITDDNFASIVAGVEEGRIAYANVRKVIFLLISTGAAELVLFVLALFNGLPIPLLPVQLLWLNLVTNGIQDVALAFEPEEGDEMRRRPRAPKEAVFNRLMIERVMVSALAIGALAFLVFQWLLAAGHGIDEARNLTLLLMVLFENVQVFNSRSETRSVFSHNPLRNPLLVFGTLIAQLFHIGAMYLPGFSEVLGVAPVRLDTWGQLLAIALVLLVVMEVHKAGWRFWGNAQA